MFESYTMESTPWYKRSRVWLKWWLISYTAQPHKMWPVSVRSAGGGSALTQNHIMSFHKNTSVWIWLKRYFTATTVCLHKKVSSCFNSSQQLLQTWACHRFLIRGEVFIHDLSVQKSTFSHWWRRRCFILPPAHVTPAVTLNCTTTHSHSHDSFLAWPVAMVIRMPHGNNYSSLIKKTNTEAMGRALSAAKQSF